jgi:SAM-dependent methyltransferase
VREWAKALVAGGYVELDDQGRFWMTKEADFVLGDADSAAFFGGPFQLAYGLGRNVDRLLDCFRTGGGIGYDEIGRDVTVGVERMWTPCHEQFLPGWLEHVPGLVDRLRAGAAILDVGCGRGRSTVSLARQFPASAVVGIDADAASIEGARALAASAGVTNAELRTQPVEQLDERGAYDFAYLFHALHDMPGAVSALAAIRQALRADGLLLCVESSASDDPLVNRGGYGELFATISPLFNLPVAMAGGDEGSGTIVSEQTMAELSAKAGFGSYDLISIDFPPPSLMHRFHLLRP